MAKRPVAAILDALSTFVSLFLSLFSWVQASSLFFFFQDVSYECRTQEINLVDSTLPGSQMFGQSSSNLRIMHEQTWHYVVWSSNYFS